MTTSKEELEWWYGKNIECRREEENVFVDRESKVRNAWVWRAWETRREVTYSRRKGRPIELWREHFCSLLSGSENKHQETRKHPNKIPINDISVHAQSADYNKARIAIDRLKNKQSGGRWCEKSVECHALFSL